MCGDQTLLLREKLSVFYSLLIVGGCAGDGVCGEIVSQPFLFDLSCCRVAVSTGGHDPTSSSMAILSQNLSLLEPERLSSPARGHESPRFSDFGLRDLY